MLLDAGAAVNSRDPGGATALIVAAKQGHGDVARLLVAHGADQKAIDRGSGATALVLAKHGGEEDLVSLLDLGMSAPSDVLDPDVLSCTGGRGAGAPLESSGSSSSSSSSTNDWRAEAAEGSSRLTRSSSPRCLASISAVAPLPRSIAF